MAKPDDFYQLSDLQSFANTEKYHVTATDELFHWTRRPKRLDRNFDHKRLGEGGTCHRNRRGLYVRRPWRNTRTMEDHSAYVASWLKVLKEDKRAIFSAASHGQKAADLLNSYQTGPVRHDSALVQSDNPHIFG